MSSAHADVFLVANHRDISPFKAHAVSVRVRTLLCSYYVVLCNFSFRSTVV